MCARLGQNFLGVKVYLEKHEWETHLLFSMFMFNASMVVRN